VIPVGASGRPVITLSSIKQYENKRSHRVISTAMDARWCAGIHRILSDPDLDPPGNDPGRRFTPDLALGPPEQVPVPGLLQVEMRDLFEAAA
jgi:hypothetical protein